MVWFLSVNYLHTKICTNDLVGLLMMVHYDYWQKGTHHFTYYDRDIIPNPCLPLPIIHFALQKLLVAVKLLVVQCVDGKKKLLFAPKH